MRISDDVIEKLLTRGSLTTPEQITSLKEEAVRSSRPLQEMVLQKSLFNDQSLTEAFADYAHIPFITIKPSDIPHDVLMRIPERIAKQYNAVLFQIDEDGTMHLAMDDPDDIQAVSFIQK
jgi:type IV pilus assembly protein PilB